MKKTAICAFVLVIMSGCAYQKIGDLTMISTRNIDSKTDYQLIQKYVTGKASTKGSDALETAIDNAIKKIPEGEFLKNVRVYVKNNGKKIKVEGDVWGIPSVDKQVTKTVNAQVEFKAGDRVAFKNRLGKIIEGTIVGLNQNEAIIEHKNPAGKEIKTEVKYEKLIKIEK